MSVSEPILMGTLQRFSDRFGSCGFTMDKFFSSFCLTEIGKILPICTNEEFCH